MRVVVLTEDRGGAAHLEALLARAGHDVRSVNAADALERALGEGAELAIVDGALAGGGALALCQRLRGEHPRLALLLITAPGDVDERVLGLDAGADDCLARPFAPAQMVARVGALGRRAAREDADPVEPTDPTAPIAPIEIDGCTLDLARAVARRGSLTIQLTAREVALLGFLHQHRARVVARAELLSEVWGVSPRNATRAVDVAVAELRRKLELDRAHPRIVRSVKGLGYVWGG
ncbi:MAG TPA: response regulator transcription factor [Polyangia bacterium]|nr:response regulator transcription factor [Polyangia bacterium]